MRLGSLPLNTPGSKSIAWLVRVTGPDHRRGAADRDGGEPFLFGFRFIAIGGM